jgi:UDP-N-acetylglucosamine 2-epimerase
VCKVWYGGELGMDGGMVVIFRSLRKRQRFFFIIKPTRCTNFTNLFWHATLHVSDSSSVHHQEFIHCTLSSGICHTG